MARVVISFNSSIKRFMIDFSLSLEQNKELVGQKIGIPMNQTFELINKQYNATVDEISLFKENDQIEIILQNMDTGHRTSQLSIIPKQQIFPQHNESEKS